MRLEPIASGKMYVLGDTEVSIGVVEINIGKDIFQESFGTLESVF